MLVEFECPKCKGHACERWGLDSPKLGTRLMYWHMILNPGIAVNELILGQRQPRNVFICTSCDAPLVDRSYVFCPGCETFHQGRVWSYANAFKNWLGLICPKCGAEIPCLWNLTSRLVLALTAPIWYLPVRRNRHTWLETQRKRIALKQDDYIGTKSQAPKKISYVRMGVSYGLLMLVGFTLLFPPLFLLAMGAFNVQLWLSTMGTTALVGLLTWPLAGLAFGFLMQCSLQKKGSPERHISFDPHGQIEPLQFTPGPDQIVMKDDRQPMQ